jgi:hypothetical protein
MRLTKELIFDLIIILTIAAWTYLNPNLTALEDKYPILFLLITLFISRLKSNEKINNKIITLKKELNSLKEGKK